MPPSFSAGSLKKMDASSPARKAHTHEIYEKASSISNTLELPWPVRGGMKKKFPTKPV
jgi:predicted NUDIX family NTP pyrophosphohydrolase